MKRDKITAEELRRLLHYDPQTGIFKWKVDRRMGRTGKGHIVAHAGAVAGKVDESTGYLQINIRGRRYLMHRLAVLYMTGEWPAGEVDHRDTDRANNIWENLRDVTKQVNTQNLRTVRSDNKLGLQGVQYDSHGKKIKRFRSRIVVDGKTKRLGYFHTAEEAHQVYLLAKRKLHEGCTI